MVSFYGDFENEKLYYFDSYGYKEPEEVTKLMNRLRDQGKELNKDIKLYRNNIRHQFKNSECGVYSINFIVKMLEGGKFEDVINEKVKDDDMQTNRDVFYLNENKL